MAKIKIKENRRAEEARKRETAKVDFERKGQTQEKLDVIAEYLGLKETDKEKND